FISRPARSPYWMRGVSWPIRLATSTPCAKLFILLLTPDRQSKLNELFPQPHPADAQPAGGLGLVALRQLNGLLEQFRFQIRDQARVGVVNVATLRTVEQFSNVSG